MGNSTIFGFIPGIPGPFEIAIIAGIFLLLFGKRIPGVMRSLGSSVVEFKKGISGVSDDAEKSDAEDAGKSES
jgi:sec-independent protein translocase protein TatA